MTYTAQESEAAVVLSPTAPADAAVIWLHGLGADGYDFVPVAPELQLPESLAVRFIFPHARARPVTINNGFVMRAWYDITGFGAARQEDDAGIRESERVVRQLIEEQKTAGVPASRIVIAGFSQGGAIALQTGLRYPEPIAGIMALSTYLPLQATVAAEASPANRTIPILMCHGLRDAVIDVATGAASRDALRALGYQVQWESYPMEHNVCMEEIVDISKWLQARFAL